MLIEFASSSHGSQGMGLYWASNPVSLIALATKTEDYTTAPQTFKIAEICIIEMKPTILVLQVILLWNYF